jgi:dCTP deaminase
MHHRLQAMTRGSTRAESQFRDPSREGLNIATATIIDPGYQGIITPELANFGEIPIRLCPGLRIAQIAFYELTASNSRGKSESVKKSQFDLAFEPAARNISKRDGKFIPEES